MSPPTATLATSLARGTHPLVSRVVPMGRWLEWKRVSLSRVMCQILRMQRAVELEALLMARMSPPTATLATSPARGIHPSVSRVVPMGRWLEWKRVSLSRVMCQTLRMQRAVELEALLMARMSPPTATLATKPARGTHPSVSRVVPMGRWLELKRVSLSLVKCQTLRMQRAVELEGLLMARMSPPTATLATSPARGIHSLVSRVVPMGRWLEWKCVSLSLVQCQTLRMQRAVELE